MGLRSNRKDDEATTPEDLSTTEVQVGVEAPNDDPPSGGEVEGSDDVTGAPLTSEGPEETNDDPDSVPGPSEDADADAQRAAALAHFAAGGDVDDEESVGGTDTPAPLESPAHTGVKHEWGGDRDYLVVSDLFNYQFGDLVRTAYKGDVVQIPDPERGLELGALTAVD